MAPWFHAARKRHNDAAPETSFNTGASYRSDARERSAHAPGVGACASVQRALERAVALASAQNLNIHDASIVAAALESGCDVVMSEDMQNGQLFAGSRIENPFL